MKGASFLALLGFFFFNVVQSTPWKLDDFQQSWLMIVAWIGASVTLSKIMPEPPPRPKTRTIVKYVETTKHIPTYGSPEGPGNPDQGQPEHNHYGLGDSER